MAGQPYGKTILIHGLEDGQQLIGYPSAKVYEKEVRDVLKGIEDLTDTGKALLLAINHPDLQIKKRMCHIIPAPYRIPGDTQTFPLHHEPCNVVIYYNPRTWMAFAQTSGIDPKGRGYGPRDVLFHELVHALIKMVGKFLSKPSDDEFDDLEDFYAILLTNIYLSEQNKQLDLDQTRLLRGDHDLEFHSLDEVSPDLTTPLAFYERFKFKIDDLFEVNDRVISSLAAKINAVECDFNPLAARGINGELRLDPKFTKAWKSTKFANPDLNAKP